MSLGKILKKENDKITYESDFGDGWMHEIVLEKMLDRADAGDYPVCVEGKNACPPEDCGGPGGYAQLIAIINDPNHPGHDEMYEWLEAYFLPREFDVAKVNELLQKDDFGVISFLGPD